MRLFESKLKPLVVYNPADILMKYKMKPGDYVSIAYIADVLHGLSSAPIKTGRMYNINYDTDAQLQEYIDELPNNNIKTLLTDFRNSQKYQDLLNGTGKTKTTKLDLSTEHIIKLSHLTCNWKDYAGLAKFYQKQSDNELALRREYGFEDGFDDPIEPDEDREENWRDKYNGRNILPRTKKGYNGNVYKDATIIPGIYASLSDPNSISLRFAYNSKSSHKDSEYFYVNGDGTLFPLNKAFVTFLTYAYKDSKKQTGEEITGEEKEFVMKLNKILKEAPSTAEVTLKCDQILFLKSTARDTKVIKDLRKAPVVPFVWINTKSIMDTYSFINSSELNKIIRKLVYSIDDEDINGTIENINIKGKSISDLVNFDVNGNIDADPAEIRNRLGLSEALKNLAMTYNKNKQLYESIMSKVSKMVKKSLNEYALDADDYKPGDETMHLKDKVYNILFNIENQDMDPYFNITDYQIYLQKTDQWVCEIMLDNNELVIKDENKEDIDLSLITVDDWKDILDAINEEDKANNNSL